MADNIALKMKKTVLRLLIQRSHQPARYHQLLKSSQFLQSYYQPTLYLHQTRHFSTSPPSTGFYDTYLSELNYSATQGLDELVEKMEDFSKVLYENLDSITQEEVAVSLQRVFETAQSQKKGTNTLLNQMILILNDVFDAFPPREMGHTLGDRFTQIMKEMEVLLKNNIHSLSMEPLTNAAYYYCKFQQGSNEFWNAIEDQIIKSREALSIEQLSKILLSFTMNKRQIKDQFWKDFLSSILGKIDKASSKDTFYLSMALGRNRINPAIINTDLYYTIYLNASRHAVNDEFDLYQLSQLSMFMCSPQASPYVPDEFWTETLEKCLTSAIGNFKKYEGQINKEVYLDDFVRVLVSFALRQAGTQAFVNKIEGFLLGEIDTLKAKMLENVIFFFSKCGTQQNSFIITMLLKKVQDEKLVETGEVRDHVMLMNLCNQYKVDTPQLWDQIEAFFTRAFLKPNIPTMPADQQNGIVSFYVFEFARANKGNEIWKGFTTFMKSRVESRQQLDLHAIAHFSYVMATKGMVEDAATWRYLQEQIVSLLASRNLTQDSLDIENICMIVASFHAAGQMQPDLQNLILKKVTENLQSLSIDELAKLFTTISRYASQEDGTGQQSPQFQLLKKEVAKSLDDKSFHLRLSDMIRWSVPLAAEEVKNERVWKKFRDLVLENQDSIQFKDSVNLAWSFTKVGLADDKGLWDIFEGKFTEELKAQAGKDNMPQALASLCFALKDQPNLSPQFWSLFRRHLESNKEKILADENNKEIVEVAVRDNKNLSQLQQVFPSQSMPF
ncbi:hypothetical protein FGO68_gene13221 [Halteria grandinella]|uniref:Uncharacterized protein n=1 Tax=Halteria grandinella TaxID=5974 RepID=A0A8J8T543_HALGN|nr:hypothetical protein FGO68_gene13221 [Halteria grandinella]